MLWTIDPSRYANTASFEERLGYVFQKKELLSEALTHRSALVGVAEITEQVLATRPWNERLEFLGDSVLGLVVSEFLWSSGLGLSEGEMSKIRSKIVCESHLAQIAQTKLKLGDALVLGGSELASDGRNKASILADAFEAVIGAMYMDGGWSKAREITRALLHQELVGGDLRRFQEGDPKTIFQEWAQEKLKLTPVYDVVAESGPAHRKQFEVAAKIGADEWGRGTGVSKKDAAQMAAAAALAGPVAHWSNHNSQKDQKKLSEHDHKGNQP